jgi:hypothetical protein
MGPQQRYTTSGWGAYIGTVDEVLAWPENKLTSFKRGGVMVRLRTGLEQHMLFTLQPRAYGMLIRDFGGSVDAAEHPVHAALREGLEESLFVLRPWLQLRRVGASKVYAYMDTLYVLLDLRGVAAADLRNRFLSAKKELAASGKPIPPELNETHDFVCVSMSEIRKRLAYDHPCRYENSIWSKSLWQSLRGLVPIFR